MQVWVLVEAEGSASLQACTSGPSLREEKEDSQRQQKRTLQGCQIGAQTADLRNWL